MLARSPALDRGKNIASNTVPSFASRARQAGRQAGNSNSGLREGRIGLKVPASGKHAPTPPLPAIWHVNKTPKFRVPPTLSQSQLAVETKLPAGQVALATPESNYADGCSESTVSL